MADNENINDRSIVPLILSGLILFFALPGLGFGAGYLMALDKGLNDNSLSNTTPDNCTEAVTVISCYEKRKGETVAKGYYELIRCVEPRKSTP